MTKFNKFDQYVIEQALELWVENFEREIEGNEEYYQQAGVEYKI